jgi:3-hydroxyacyl-CoA dehydrogenase/enoyl-CoA hydratase/3-hydroxybutyryl-CoA epimerase
MEAVFEPARSRPKPKKAAVLRDSAILVRTPRLTITASRKSAAPRSFIGIHFFSPVERMGLVKIIVGKKTGSRALALSLD